MTPAGLKGGQGRIGGERNAAFLILITLVFLTAAFYREFSHLAVPLAGMNVFVTELALAAILTLLLLETLRTGVVSLQLASCAPLALIFLAWGLVCLYRGWEYGLVSVRESATNYYSLFYLLIALVVNNSRKIMVLAGSIAAGATISFLIVALRVLTGEGAETSTGALRFHAPVAVGGAAALFGLLAAPASSGSRRAAYAIGACVAVLVTVVATQHRSAAIALGVSTLCWFVWFQRGRASGAIGSRGTVLLLVLGTALAVALIPSIAEQTFTRLGSIGSEGEEFNKAWRLLVWGLLVSRVLVSPLVGFGFGDNLPTFEFRGVTYGMDPSQPFGVHNSFIFVAYKEGLVGVAVLIAFSATIVYRCTRLLNGREAPNSLTWIGAASLAAFVFVLAFAQFNVVLEGPYMGMFFWLFAGIAEAALMRSGSHEPPIGREPRT